MKKLLIVAAALALAGCQTEQVVTRTQLEVVIPDRSLFVCPSTKYPNPDTLTDVEVAKLLVTLQRNNADCKRNMNAIRTYLEDAKAQTEATQ